MPSGTTDDTDLHTEADSRTPAECETVSVWATCPSARRAVVAGHKNRDLPDDPAILDETRQYLLDAIRILGESTTAREHFDQMTARHPDRLNPGPVSYGALGLLGE
ncbi:hypothetical protein ACIHCM_29495 [Streptomyces sp. NPDC052023]|uniref:hypothetical protein n=1 Tax=Streptomyces sp. NPDC052023 TaxID=3365681 RepID=UPI0037CE01B1